MTPAEYVNAVLDLGEGGGKFYPLAGIDEEAGIGATDEDTPFDDDILRPFQPQKAVIGIGG